MIRLTVKFDVDRVFRGWCTAKAAGLKDWARGAIQAGPAMLRALEQHHDDVFQSGGAASGMGAWAALRPRTLRLRARGKRVSRIAPFDYAAAAGSGVGILRWSARLYKSLATQGNSYGDQIRLTRNTGITFGTSTRTALFHAAGRQGRNPMVVRSPLDSVRGPEVALDVAESKIMEFLLTDEPGAAPSPGLVRNAAGFYAKR